MTAESLFARKNPGLPPHNQEAEQGLIGALLIDNRALESVAEIVKPADFFVPSHGRIFEAMLSFSERGLSFSPVSLKSHFENDADLPGGAMYLAELAAAVVSSINAPDYAAYVKDLSLRRAVIGISDETKAEAFHFGLEARGPSVIESAEEKLFALAEKGSTGGFLTMEESYDKTLQMIEDMQSGKSAGFPTGIDALDKKTGGLFPKEMTVVGGRPSMGKSALLCTLAYNLARAGHPVGVFSLEMTAEQLVQRILARVTKIPVWKQRRQGYLQREDFSALAAARRDIAAMPLYIDDAPGLSAAQIRSRARRLKRRCGLDAVFVDFLQKMSFSDRYMNKTDKIGEATGALYNAAKELNFALMLFSQLNRGVEGRDDKRPQLDDLRDSGEIEQDANNVWFLYRDEYYLTKNEPKKKDSEAEEKFAQRRAGYFNALDEARGKADVIISKSRQEETGTARLGFSGPDQVFYDLEQGRLD